MQRKYMVNPSDLVNTPKSIRVSSHLETGVESAWLKWGISHLRYVAMGCNIL